MPPSATRPRLHRAVEGEHRAAVLGIALQRQHVGMAVDDAGGGRQQRGRAVQVGFHRHRLGGAQQPHALDAVGLGAALDLGELLALGLVGRHDQLAAIAMRHAVLGAIGIEQAPAGDAGPRHQAALGIVDAGVDDLGIARAGLGADAFGGLDHDDLTAGKGKRAGHGKAHDACADHDAVDGFERGRTHGRMLEHRGRPFQSPRRAGGFRSMKGALVTGAGVRVGRALAMALAADGFFVFVHYNARPPGARDGGRYRRGRRQGQGRAGRSLLGAAGRGAGREVPGAGRAAHLPGEQRLAVQARPRADGHGGRFRPAHGDQPARAAAALPGRWRGSCPPARPA